MFNCLSWGFPKMPLHRFKNYGSPLPVPGCPVSFGRRVATPPSRSVLQVLHLSDGLRLPVACGCISIRFRSWGSPRCILPRSRNSRACLPTLRSLPSARSDENPRCRAFSWEGCHRCVPLRVPRSPSFLPLSSLAFLLCCHTKNRWTSGSCSTRRVRCIPQPLPVGGARCSPGL